MRGPVLLRVSGLVGADAPAASTSARGRRVASALASAMSDAPPRPLAEMWHLVCDGRPAVPALLAFVCRRRGGALSRLCPARAVPPPENGHVLGLASRGWPGWGCCSACVRTPRLDSASGAGLPDRPPHRARCAPRCWRSCRLGRRYYRPVSSRSGAPCPRLDARAADRRWARALAQRLQLGFTAMALLARFPELVIELHAARSVSRFAGDRENHGRTRAAQRASAALTRHYLDSCWAGSGAHAGRARRALSARGCRWSGGSRLISARRRRHRRRPVLFGRCGGVVGLGVVSRGARPGHEDCL